MNFGILLFSLFLMSMVLPGCGAEEKTKSAEQANGDGSGDESVGSGPGSGDLGYLDRFDPCKTTNLTAIFDCDGEKLPDDQATTQQVNWMELDPKISDHKRLSGVGRYGDCTGSLVDTGEDDGPSYVLTNGHCVYSFSVLKQGLHFDLEPDGEKMSFRYYVGDKSAVVEAVAELIVFASMDQTDTALVRLKDVTLKELKNSGVSSFRLSEKKPENNQDITLVGVPLSEGMGASSVVGTRLSHCKSGTQVYVKEHIFNFGKSIRHNCSIVGGNSGSPIFDRNTMEIIMVNNTTVNDDSDDVEACELNRPCEVSSSGSKSLNIGINYGQSTWFLANCFDQSGVFDRSLEECKVSEANQI